MRRVISTLLILSVCVVGFGSFAVASGEESLTRGAASLLIPGLGQYINGELGTQGGKIKTGTMILLEVGAIITTAVVGGVAGFPQVWAGLGIFLFNHIWSAADAFMHAPAGPEISLKEPVSNKR